MKACVCFHTSVFRGVTRPISWVIWLSTDTFSESWYIHGPRWNGHGVWNTGKDDVPSRPRRTPFSSLTLVFTLVHSETCLAVLALIPRFEASVGITADFPRYSGLRARFLGSSHSSKDSSLRVSSAPVVCHLNCSRAETTTSFNFKALSAFHSSHSSSCSSSSTLNWKLLSDSQSQASTAFTMLKKTSWSCHKHNNTCQIKVSLHRTNYLHLTEQLSAHIFQYYKMDSKLWTFSPPSTHITIQPVHWTSLEVRYQVFAVPQSPLQVLRVHAEHAVPQFPDCAFNCWITHNESIYYVWYEHCDWVMLIITYFYCRKPLVTYTCYKGAWMT